MLNSNSTSSPKKPFVIGAFSPKGGPGKTTSICNLAGLLADFGYKVLLVDTDPQASCTQFYVSSNTHVASNGMTALLKSGGLTIDSSYISNTTMPGLDLIISDYPGVDGGAVLQEFSNRIDAMKCLERAVNSPALADYDFILIDTQGALGKLQSASIYASDVLISPFKPTTLDATAFLHTALPILQSMGLGTDMNLFMPKRMFAFANDVSATGASKTTMAFMQEALSENTEMTLLDVVVKRSTRFAEAPAAKKPVHLLDKTAFETMHRLLWGVVGQDFPEINGRYCNDWNKEVVKQSSVAKGV
jgi:chromosome partitioning related protein ParA